MLPILIKIASISESSHQGDSNEHPKHRILSRIDRFLWKIDKNYISNIIKYTPYLFFCLTTEEEVSETGGWSAININWSDSVRPCTGWQVYNILPHRCQSKSALQPIDTDHQILKITFSIANCSNLLTIAIENVSNPL